MAVAESHCRRHRADVENARRLPTGIRVVAVELLGKPRNSAPRATAGRRERRRRSVVFCVGAFSAPPSLPAIEEWPSRSSPSRSPPAFWPARASSPPPLGWGAPALLRRFVSFLRIRGRLAQLFQIGVGEVGAKTGRVAFEKCVVCLGRAQFLGCFECFFEETSCSARAIPLWWVVKGARHLPARRQAASRGTGGSCVSFSRWMNRGGNGQPSVDRKATKIETRITVGMVRMCTPFFVTVRPKPDIARAKPRGRDATDRDAFFPKPASRFPRGQCASTWLPSRCLPIP